MAISATTSILTGDDWQYAKDVRPGDWVFNRFGKPVKVTLAQIYRSEDCYRVTFDDGIALDIDNHTKLPTEDLFYRVRASKYKGKLKRTTQLKLQTPDEMLDTGLRYRGNRITFSVPTTEPIQLPEQPLDIPPFIFGFWYATKNRRQVMHVGTEFAEETFEKFKEHGYKIQIVRQKNEKFLRFKATPSIWKQVVGRNIKSIPLKYLFGSHEQRADFVKGVLATMPAKMTSKTGNFLYINSNKRTLTAMQFLFESLGAKTSYNPKKPTKLIVNRLAPFIKGMFPERGVAHLARRFVKNIEPIEPRLCVHIETDDEDGSIVVGEGFVPCH